MAKLYKCDKCGEHTTEPLRVAATMERTPEEIREIMAANELVDNAYDRYRAKQASLVNKHLDLCRKCFDKFREDYMS